MLTDGKSAYRSAGIAVLGIITCIIGIFAYFDTTTIKGACLKFLSLASRDRPGASIASACGINRESEDDQILFISCGGIY